MSVSAVLVRKDNYISKVLANTKTRYMKIDKHLYALIVLPHKLRPSFQAHVITVLTKKMLKHFLQESDLSWKMFKRAIELDEFKIHFAPNITIKGQNISRLHSIHCG